MSQPDDNTRASALEDDERFDLTSRTEIVFGLKELIHRGELVTVSFNGGADLVLTTLLSVDRDDDTLVFDWGGSEPINQKLLKSERNIFVATARWHQGAIRCQTVSMKRPSATIRRSSPICRKRLSACSDVTAIASPPRSAGHCCAV